MRSITLSEFQKRGYDKTGVGTWRLIGGVCCKCKQAFEYSCVDAFIRNRRLKIDKKHLWDTCSKCWFYINTREDPLWIEKNKQAQLIVQNTPEQKLKNAIGVSKSWDEERRKKASELLKDRLENDQEFREKALSTILQFNLQPKKIRMEKSFGTGGLKGSYNNINYDSLLELSFLIWCERNNINVRRYDLDPILYIAEDNKIRRYIPDFIINDSTIVEIKGIGLYYRKNYERNIRKLESAKKFVEGSQYSFRCIMEKEEPIRRFYKFAKKIHHENKE